MLFVLKETEVCKEILEQQAKKLSSFGVWVETMTLIPSRSFPQGVIVDSNIFEHINVCGVECDVINEEMGLSASHSQQTESRDTVRRIRLPHTADGFVVSNTAFLYFVLSHILFGSRI